MAKITFNTSTFATRDAHMVLYESDIYEGWIQILERQRAMASGRQPSITVFRCLRGLADEEIKIIQTELLEDKIVLVKQNNQNNIVDIITRSKELKQTKVFRQELVKVFKEIDPCATISTWDDCMSTYNVTEKIYQSLFISCVPWLELKLQQTKETPEFPSVTRGYVKWIVDKKNGVPSPSTAFPWVLKSVGNNLEGIEFLGEEESSQLSVGVCIIDATHSFIAEGRWPVSNFSKVLDGLSNISYKPSQFVIVAFVTYKHVKTLERALASKAGWYDMVVMSIDSLISTDVQAFTPLNDITFAVVAFFAEGEEFNDIQRIKDAILVPMNCLHVDTEEFDAVMMAKTYIARRAIQSVCVKENDHVVDMFSLGYATKEALQQQRKVITVSCTSEQTLQLQNTCIETVEADPILKRWAGIDMQPSAEASNVVDVGEDADDEDDDLEANADALLQSIVRPGQP